MHMYTYTYNLVVNVYILISKTLFKATAQFDWGLNDASLLDLKAKSINKKCSINFIILKLIHLKNQIQSI